MPRPENPAATLAAADVFALLAGLSGLRRAVEVATAAAAQHAVDDAWQPEEATTLPDVVALVHRRPWW
jgi:hypothetical protein